MESRYVFFRLTSIASVFAASLFAFTVQSAYAQGFGLVNQLQTTCSNDGDSAHAEFVNNPITHNLVLSLQASGNGASAQGNAYFANPTFHSIAVNFIGECHANFEPASFQVRVLFVPPGTTTVLNHGYNCETNTVAEASNGEKRMVITSQSLCDCHMHIPPGSILKGLWLVLTVDGNSDETYSFLIDRVEVNGHAIHADFRTPTASCDSEK